MTDSEPQIPHRAIWVLTDDRPGNTAQAMGVAHALSTALGRPIAEIPMRYTAWVRLPNALRGASLLGITDDSRTAFSPPWPDVVIAAGRRLAPVARWIKQQSIRDEMGRQTVLAQIMDPGSAGAQDFDVIAVPEHDSGRKAKSKPNVITITGTPSRITPEVLICEAEHWRVRFKSLPHPRIALMVGGATKRRGFPVQQARDLGVRVAELVKASGGSVLLATSRRTGPAAEQALLHAIPEPRMTYVWGQSQDGGGEERGENPYLGFLASADAIIVTGDSVSMCAEACATDRPVYIHAPSGTVSAKHARLHRQLFDLGVAKPLGEALEDWKHPPLNPAADIATAIRRILVQNEMKSLS